MPIVRPERPCSASVVQSCAREPLQDRLELVEPAEVAVEGRLARLGLGHAPQLEVARVLEAGQAPEVRAQPRAEPRRERARPAVPPSAASVVMPWASSRWTVLGPMPGMSPGEASGEAGAGLGRRQLEEAVRLVGVRGDLGHQLARPDADRAAQAGALVHGRLDPARRRPVAIEAGEVHVGLVEAHHLQALHVAAQHGHHVPRARAVELEVGRDEHRLGAEPAGALGGRGGEDPEAARLVAGGGDHRPRPAARHHHRLPAQLGTALELDAHVERVHVEMCVDVGAVFHRPTSVTPPQVRSRSRSS